VAPSDLDIIKTPAGRLKYDPYGPGWKDWGIAAQAHYSFLQHLEEESLWRYKFNLWDYQYNRISINFIGFWGDDIVDAFPFPIHDDEEYLTTVRPMELGRREHSSIFLSLLSLLICKADIVLDGTVLSVHFAFGTQRRGPDEENHPGGGLYHTDLLNRYKVYAEEMVCPFPTRSF